MKASIQKRMVSQPSRKQSLVYLPSICHTYSYQTPIISPDVWCIVVPEGTRSYQCSDSWSVLLALWRLKKKPMVRGAVGRNLAQWISLQFGCRSCIWVFYASGSSICRINSRGSRWDDQEVSGCALHKAWMRHCIGSSHLSFSATKRAAEKQEGKALATWAAVLRNATGTTRALALVLCLGSSFFCDLLFQNCIIVCLSFLCIFPPRIDKRKGVAYFHTFWRLQRVVEVGL